MDTSFHYLLMANQAILHKKLLAGLKDTCLTLGQPKVLDYLKDHNGVSQKEIAEGCHIEAASLTSLLTRMEEKDIIVRKMLNGNRRSLHVFLTQKGEVLQKAVAETFLLLENDAFHDISEADRIQFMNTFFKIYENLRQY